MPGIRLATAMHCCVFVFGNFAMRTTLPSLSESQRRLIPAFAVDPDSFSNGQISQRTPDVSSAFGARPNFGQRSFHSRRKELRISPNRGIDCRGTPAIES